MTLAHSTAVNASWLVHQEWLARRSLQGKHVLAESGVFRSSPENIKLKAAIAGQASRP